MLLALIVSLLAGLATTVGALVALLPWMRRDVWLGAALAFAAGAMVAICVVEIVPRTYEDLAQSHTGGGAVALTAVSVLVGVGVVIALATPWLHHRWTRSLGRGSAEDGAGDTRVNLRRSAVLVAAVVALHNLPEGMGTFLATVSDPALGISLAVAIALHNVPEGVAVAAPILAATGSRAKAIGWATCSGLAEFAGAMIGLALLGSVLPETVVPVVFGGIAGMMVAISVREMLPAAARLLPQVWPRVAAVASGAMVMVASLALLAGAE